MSRQPYRNSVLPENHSRSENAIGYTQDDVIMFKTFQDYKDKNLDYSRADLQQRRLSVPHSNRNQPINKLVEAQVGSTEHIRDTVKKLLPEVFNFSLH